MDLKTENAKFRLAYFDMQIRQAAERAAHYASEYYAYEAIEKSYRDDLERAYEQIRLDTIESGMYPFSYYEPILEKLDTRCQTIAKKVNIAKKEAIQALSDRNKYKGLKNEFIKIQKLK